MQSMNKKVWRWGLLGLVGLALMIAGNLYAPGIWSLEPAPYGIRLPKVVAKVGEDPISRDLVYQRMRQYEGMNPQGLKNKETDAMKKLAIGVVDQLIQQQLIIREAQRLHITVADAQVEQQYVRTQANFGSPAEFEKKLKEGNTDVQTLKHDIRDFVLIQKVDYTLQQQIPVLDQEIKDFFESNKEQLLQDRVRARHILVENPQQAGEALHLLKQGGKDFDEVARLYSRDEGTRERGGELGWFTKGQMVPEFEAAVFSLKPGEISKLIQTQFGYHIIKLEEIQSASQQTLQDHRDHILNILRNQKWQLQKQDWLNQLYQQSKIWKAVEVTL